ncbi:hypothetical protein EX30DRAFT_395486 [Ascodesmis nigricans]|uniref:Uncharacterized protein n=1 Tax=Ascodesmis nigricans TaxID=341454 RepID=A0A4V3SIW5_9PEZI|nr:hypothetical protein EX30DRAFT_395486 [Ascodesmis nigricans]
MSTTGTTIPEINTTAAGPIPSGEEAPTESHAIAAAPLEEHPEAAGALHHEAAVAVGEGIEVKDLGWNEKPENVPNPLIGGLNNEELWTLVRRFNKQMYHVKAIDERPPGGLDLNIAAEDEFSPDKLRSNVERLYMTVIVGLVAFIKHIARIRSWKEVRRTSCFFAGYFIAWAFDLLVPTILTMLITLIVYPRSRYILFPPAPLALIDPKTGGVQKPKAGLLGSHGSLTGAPEKHQGEAVEQEAHNFVSSFGAIALSSAAGKHESGNEALDEDSSTEQIMPDPTSLATHAADAKKGAEGEKHKDKAKQPMEEKMWEGVRPAMHAIGDIADMWERVSNALSPTRPFPQHRSRLKLAGVLTPVLLISLFLSPYMVIKGTTFILGVAFFGDPLFIRGYHWLNANIPNWMDYLDIRNNILRGVPTNAQLTITLLRIGEARRAPIPPPPGAKESEHIKGDNVKGFDPEHAESIGASDHEISDAMHPDEDQPTATSEGDGPKKKHKPGAKILGFFKGTTKTTMNTALSTDPMKAKMGSKKAQNRLGAVPSAKAEPPTSGPIEFPARFKGKRGVLKLVEDNGGVLVYERKGNMEFDIPVPKIREVKKIGGLGWKSKLAVGWSMQRDVLDGLEFVVRWDNGLEETWMLTAVGRRDELFNRVVALSSNMWESW